MKISEINIVPVKPNNGLIGFVSCVLDDSYYIGSIAIYTKLDGGYRLLFPTKVLGDSQLHYHHPITKEMGEELKKAILEKVENLFTT